LHRTLIESAPVFFHRSAPNGDLIWCSERFYEYTGLIPEKVEGRAWQPEGLVHPDDVQATVGEWWKSSRTGQQFELELRLRGADGVYRWFLSNQVPIRDESGAIVEWIGTSTNIDDRRRASEELRLSEERYRTLAETAPVFVFRTDAAGRVSYASERFYEYTGLTPQEVEGDRWQLIDLIHPEDREGAVDGWRRAVATGKSDGAEVRLRRSDGLYHWYLTRVAPVYSNGQIVEWAGTSTDIHASKLAHEALESALAREGQGRSLLDTMLDAVPAGIVFVDKDLRFLTLNRAAAEINGLPIEKHLGQSGPELFPDLPPQIWETMLQVIETGEPARDIEVTAEAPGAPGAVRWWAVSFYPVSSPDGSTSGVVEVFSEITGRKRAEIAQQFIADATSALASSLDHEQTLRDVARLAVPAVCDVCVVDIIEDGTPRRLDGIGATAREAELIAEIHMRDWRAPGRENEVIQQALTEGRPIFMPEVPQELLAMLAPNERQRSLVAELAPRSVIQLPLKSRGGVFGAVTFVITRSHRRFDAADLAMAEELGRRASIAADNARLYAEAQKTMDELRRANAVKDEFLSLISHELRTPMTTIYGNARLIRDKYGHLTEEARKQATQDLAEESERLQRIVENLLLLTQLDSGQVLEREPMHLPNLVRAWIAAFQKREPSRAVDLVVEPLVPLVLGVPTYAELACDNLLRNAHKYSPLDEPITVVVRGGSGTAEVIVRDHGPGIDPEEAEDLFTPFYRSRRMDPMIKGIGIGLAVSKRVVEAQGGEIWARGLESGGAEFGFTLTSIEGHQPTGSRRSEDVR
jgi:PAS domain S-box-containing protein